MTVGYGRIIVPGFTTLVLMVVLIGLGTWQVQRLHWKQTILAQISEAEAALAVPLSDEPAPYTKVSVSGRFRFDRAAQYGIEVRDTRAGPTVGSDQIVPLDRDGAPPLLVDRGWVPRRLVALVRSRYDHLMRRTPDAPKGHDTWQRRQPQRQSRRQRV